MALGNVLDIGVPSDSTVSSSKIIDGAVSLAKLSATGTKDATTFLRGDNTFAVPAGGENTPAFTAYMGSNQSISATTLTTVSFDTEKFDTDGCYDTSTYRFTPTEAGKYLFFFNTRWDLTGNYDNLIEFEIRHSVHNSLLRISGATRYRTTYSGSVIIDMNGSTDFVYVSIYQDTGATRNLDAGDGDCKFGGFKLIGV